MALTLAAGDGVLLLSVIGNPFGQSSLISGGGGLPTIGVVDNTTGPVVLWPNGQKTTYASNAIFAKIAPFSDTIRAGGNASHFGGDTALLKNFADVVMGHANSLTPISIGIQSVYACLAAKESTETGRFVKVRQVGAVK